MDEVNACIAANAAQEELVDQPERDTKVLRVSGPFTVEGVIPAEESISLDWRPSRKTLTLRTVCRLAATRTPSTRSHTWTAWCVCCGKTACGSRRIGR
jgi:hypothetical protein